MAVSGIAAADKGLQVMNTLYSIGPLGRVQIRVARGDWLDPEPTARTAKRHLIYLEREEFVPSRGAALRDLHASPRIGTVMRAASLLEPGRSLAGVGQ